MVEAVRGLARRKPREAGPNLRADLHGATGAEDLEDSAIRALQLKNMAFMAQ
jgi:hypothetical protein